MTSKLAFGLWLLPADVRTALEPGETPLAWEGVFSGVSDDRIGKDPRGKIVTGFSVDPVASGIRTDDGFVERTLGGVSATGAEGSAAAVWSAGLARTARQHALVTDRRLLLVEGGGRRTGGGEVRLSAAIPRPAVATVRHRPRPLAVGRVGVEFTDGSTIAVTLALLSWRPARRFVRAFRTGQPQNG